jgi:hypothetical protein
MFGTVTNHESGDVLREIAALDHPIEWMRDCEVCGEPRRFVAEVQLLNGYYGECLGCGTKSVVPFTRVTSEAA